MNTAHWSTSRLLSTAARLNDQHETQRLTDLGVTHAGATTLTALEDSGPITQTHLAALVRVTGSTIGQILEKLEFKGLVSRARDFSDARSMQTRITVRGRNLLHRIDQRAADAAVSAALPDQVLRKQLIDIITRLGPVPA
ncbi:MarR family winged helix-turn-helix transcriptional regulator [Arthrobacter sp. MDT1-65]